MARISEQSINIWTARIIPLLLIGAVGYSVYVVVAQIAVKHLLKPSNTSIHSPRHGVAGAILAIYFLLFLPMAVTYFRLLYVMIANPGFVPRGPQWYAKRREEEEDALSGRGFRLKRLVSSNSETRNPRAVLSDPSHLGARDKAAMEDLTVFYNKEVYACNGDGRPPWCSHCLNWKPDRAHHCSQIDRCVLKMDHFCPWVGGIVSETSFKFFVQFLVYAALFCIFLLVTTAYFLAETARKGPKVNVHFAILLGLSGVLGIFSSSMAGSAIYFVVKNLTTIENLSKKAAIWNFAVRIPDWASVPPLPTQSSTGLAGSTLGPPPTQIPTGSNESTLRPLPGEMPRRPADSTGSHAEKGSDTSNVRPDNPRAVDPAHPPRIAVLRTKIGENPWDLGAWENWKSVMGNRVVDWFFPLNYSPCCDHNGTESAYPLGPVVPKLRSEFGLASMPPGSTGV